MQTPVQGCMGVGRVGGTAALSHSQAQDWAVDVLSILYCALVVVWEAGGFLFIPLIKRHSISSNLTEEMGQELCYARWVWACMPPMHWWHSITAGLVHACVLPAYCAYWGGEDWVVLDAFDR
jgi:hypothetical protein